MTRTVDVMVNHDRGGDLETNGREDAAKDVYALQSETPAFVARAAAVLAADPSVKVKSGQAPTCRDLAEVLGRRRRQPSALGRYGTWRGF